MAPVADGSRAHADAHALDHLVPLARAFLGGIKHAPLLVELGELVAGLLREHAKRDAGAHQGKAAGRHRDPRQLHASARRRFLKGSRLHGPRGRAARADVRHRARGPWPGGAGPETGEGNRRNSGEAPSAAAASASRPVPSAPGSWPHVARLTASGTFER